MKIEVRNLTYYFCDACHFCFEADALLDRCPDCGKQIHNEKPAVRAATAKEVAEYIKIKNELENEDD